MFLLSKMSGTYSNANRIIEYYPEVDIRIIDSKTNCMK
ncbi:hypothetical protein [Terrisporobacter glycolicus]